MPMKSVAHIRQHLSAGEFDLSRHALKRVVERNVSDREIRKAGSTADLVEEYPRGKYSPSCLLLEFTRVGRPLHIQVSRADTPLVRVVTLYEPNRAEWVDYARRR